MLISEFQIKVLRFIEKTGGEIFEMVEENGESFKMYYIIESLILKIPYHLFFKTFFKNSKPSCKTSIILPSSSGNQSI